MATEEYTRLETQEAAHITASCPICGSNPELYQFIEKAGTASKVVMCSNGDAIGPQATDGGAINSGCPFFMPPNEFYRPTIREAVGYWNKFAEALTALRAATGSKA